MRGTCVTIKPHALEHNLAKARALAGAAEIVAMVKANGYGHGLLLAAHAFEQADWLGVAVFDEAERIRAAGINTKLLLVEGFFDQNEMQQIAALGRAACVVHSAWQVAMLAKCSSDLPLEVWLKLDSGMHRLGMQQAELLEQFAVLNSMPHIKVTTLITHLACADQTDDHTSSQQINQAIELAQKLGLTLSVANSAALYRYPQSKGAKVRPGIMLYGGSPLVGQSAHDLGLQPGMTFKARLLAINLVAKGETVGYGCRWRTEQDSKIGVVGVGYGDGYPRHAIDGTPLAIYTKSGAHRVPLAGRVSMDMVTVDLTAVPDAQVGDTVELWGSEISADEVAKCCGTISYELFCQITTRPERRVAYD